MDWESFFIGVAFLLGALLLYKLRNIGNMAPDDQGYYKVINSVDRFRTWVWVIISALVGIGFIIHSL